LLVVVEGARMGKKDKKGKRKDEDDDYWWVDERAQ